MHHQTPVLVRLRKILVIDAAAVPETHETAPSEQNSCPEIGDKAWVAGITRDRVGTKN